MPRGPSAVESAREIGVTVEVYRRLAVLATNAIHRCTNKSHPQYGSYGARGIRVDPSWVADRRLFVAHLASLDGHDRPGMWLDRRNNEKGYEPGNLRFIPVILSNLNKRPYRRGHR